MASEPICRPASDFAPGGPRGLPLEAPRAAPPEWVVAGEAPLPIELRAPEPRFLVHQARFHVGDTLWLTPLLRALRRRFEDARTIVVGPPVAVDVLSGNPNVDEVIVYPEDGGHRERRSVLGALAGRMPDVALFAFARRPESAWLARAAAEAGVAHRVNLEYFDPELDSRRIWRWATHEGWFCWGSMASPAMLLHALEPFGGGSFPASTADRRVELTISDASRRRAAEVLAGHGVEGPYALLAPGGLSSKRWPAGRFAELAARLVGELGLGVLVEGSAAEAPLLHRVAAAAGSPRVVASQDPLAVFAALLERTRLLVSNDSAAIHLAEAVAAPTLYFAERQKLAHSHPVGEACWALYDDLDDDLGRISAEQAIRAIREMGLAQGL